MISYKERKQRRKKKKKEKCKKRLYYKVMHQVAKPAAPIYFLELAFSCAEEIFRRALVYLFRTGLCLLVTGCIALAIFVPASQFIIPAVHNSKASDFKKTRATMIYADNGELIACLNGTNEVKYTKYKNIPADAINAFVAVEDRTFWNNKGIDLKGIARVSYKYLQTNGEEVHGASTITQQLARNIYLSHEVSIERKIKEIAISIGLTEKYSKEEIMEYYCNNVCFANGIYGIENAAKAYFDLPLNKLTLSQTAYICAIPNSPEYYNPYVHPDRAVVRRNKILKDMYECGYISGNELHTALSEEIQIKKPENIFHDYETTYAVFCACEYLMEQNHFNFRYVFSDTNDYNNYQKDYQKAYNEAKNDLYMNGYKIYTSLNLDLCQSVQKNLDDVLSFDTQKKEENDEYALQGAVTCIDNKTGNVVALSGGRSCESGKKVYSLNRAFQGYRQPGSSIKPLIVYTPALEHGYHAESIVTNINVSQAKKPGVKTKNLGGSKMTLQNAVWKSENGVAWKLLDELSPQTGLSYLQNMDFRKICPDDYNDASALGGLTYGTTTVEMASGYRTLVNDGMYRKPTCVISIKNSNNKEIYKSSSEKRVYQSDAAESMKGILKGVLISGTAKGLKWYDETSTEAMCKTGTTNGSKDGWLCGATPYYSIAVWVGYDSPKELNNLYGATYPGDIWKKCMLNAITGKEELSFSNYDAKTISTDISAEDADDSVSKNETYEEDRKIGEKVDGIMEQMKSESGNKKELYAEALEWISEIKDESYAKTLLKSMNEIY